ncbi:hypothetical protein ACMSEZ_01440 [Bacteroides thetaiotaomicron]|uniref:hypothetical protein n=1 Tax=Bacteroides thetaiotaomicron TaxID=818 RepID=UPI0039C11EC6
MKRQFILTCICTLFAFVSTQGKTTSTPFAHAYRALGYLRADRKAAMMYTTSPDRMILLTDISIK